MASFSDAPLEGDYMQRIRDAKAWPETAAVALGIYEGFNPQITEDTQLLLVDHRKDQDMREVALLGALIDVHLVTDPSVTPYHMAPTKKGKFNRFFKYETPSGLIIAEKRTTLPRENATVGSLLRLMTSTYFNETHDPSSAELWPDPEEVAASIALGQSIARIIA